MKKIFIAFTGPKTKQKKIYNIESYYELWNLDKYDFEEFIEDIKEEIPPVNNNVLKNYKIDETRENNNSILGLSRDEFEKCSWGLLLPDSVLDSPVNGYEEIIFLLNLYSPYFLYSVFHVTDFGITKLIHKKDRRLYFHGQNQARIFKRKKFVNFFETLFSESIYGKWQADRCAKWNEEDWRLFIACLLFSELKSYENVKKTFMWQRESADMTTILEALFTAKDEDNTEILYRLRKRISVLLGFRFANIASEIKELYKQRCAFIHGSFFTQIKKQTKVVDGHADVPLPDFDFLKKQKEYIRFSLASYLYLNKIYKSDKNEFKECKNVLEILEKSIIDIGLRNKIRKHTKKLLSLF